MTTTNELPIAEIQALEELKKSIKNVRNFSYKIKDNHIIEIVLDNQELDDIPDSIYVFKELKFANFSQNLLTQIPKPFCELIKIKKKEFIYFIYYSIYQKTCRTKTSETSKHAYYYNG